MARPIQEALLNSIDISRVEFVPLREVWPHEAQDFTPWLLKNPDVLAECLGFEIEFQTNEYSIGSFSLDLLGVNSSDGTPLIVENQLDKTDHGHLGQLITYAGGVGPSTIVWIAAEFRDEHKTALEWLNDASEDSTTFFGVEVKAIRIDGSKPAPWLNIVVKPNDWTSTGRQIRSASGLSANAQLQHEFWIAFLDKYRESRPVYRRKNAPTTPWLILPTGLKDSWIGIGVYKDHLYGDLVFGSNDQDQNLRRIEFLQEHQADLHSRFGNQIEFEEVKGRKKTNQKLILRKTASLHERESWPEYALWLDDLGSKLTELTKSELFQTIREL